MTRKFSVVTWNLACGNEDSCGNCEESVERFLKEKKEVFQETDVVCVQELKNEKYGLWTSNRASSSIVDAFRDCGFPFFAGAKKSEPVTVLPDNYEWQGIFSRHPIINQRECTVFNNGKNWIRKVNLATVQIIDTSSGLPKSINVYNYHGPSGYDAGLSEKLASIRMVEHTVLVDFADSISSSKETFDYVVTGDFNLDRGKYTPFLDLKDRFEDLSKITSDLPVEAMAYVPNLIQHKDKISHSLDGFENHSEYNESLDWIISNMSIKEKSCLWKGHYSGCKSKNDVSDHSILRAEYLLK